jgi:hypothetical protein
MELSVHVVIPWIVLLYPIFWLFAILLFFLWFNFHGKVLVIFEKLICVNFTNFFQRNVGCFMLETSMNVNLVVRSPTGVSESLN